MTFDEATELGGDTTAIDTATAATPPSGIAGEDDDEEMDEESSEDVCTNLLTPVMHNIPHFLTLRCVPKDVEIITEPTTNTLTDPKYPGRPFLPRRESAD
jgi:hypothetical protein